MESDAGRKDVNFARFMHRDLKLAIINGFDILG